MDNTIYLILPTGKGKEGIKKEDIDVVQNVLRNMTDKSIFRSYGKGLVFLEKDDEHKPHWYNPNLSHWGLIYWFPTGLEPNNLAILLDLNLLIKLDELDDRYRLLSTKRIQ